jgi:hypothetical protein
MTTKPPSSRLAASGPADDQDSEQVTKEHNDDDDARDEVTVDPSEDVTVEATEDVTTEAVAQTPHPSIRPGNNTGGTAGARAPTLLGVPIQSLPLPGVTSASQQGETVRQIDYDDEITVLGQPAPADPLARLDALVDSFDRPSITDDDEEETKVEPAETAMKAAESTDDVTTALSAQASLEREKALRRSAPLASPGQLADDLEFADPEADEEVEDQEEEESLDDELSDEDEVISAGGAIEEEEDADDADAHDGVATATFMKPADSTGLSGLLNPRRPPTGNPYGRDGFGSRLPTPSPGYSPATSAPAPSTSPFASRLGPAPKGSPYSARGTGTPLAIQIPAPSGAAATPSEPGFFTRRLQVPGYGLLALVGGALVLGYGIGALGGGKSAPAPTAVVAKPAAAPAAPVVEPVVAGSTAPTGTEMKPATPPGEAPAKPTPAVADLPGSGPSDKPSAEVAPEGSLWKPATPKPKPVVDPLADDTAAKPTPAVATSPKPAVAVTPKPAVATTPKPATAAVKPAKKPTKVWVDPFAN